MSTRTIAATVNLAAHAITQHALDHTLSYTGIDISPEVGDRILIKTHDPDPWLHTLTIDSAPDVRPISACPEAEAVWQEATLTSPIGDIRVRLLWTRPATRPTPATGLHLVGASA